MIVRMIHKIYWYYNFKIKIYLLDIAKMEKKDGKKEPKVTKEADPNGANKDTHAFMVMGTRFEIDKKYEIIDPIGSGAYGVVVAAKDASVPKTEEENLTWLLLRKSSRPLSIEYSH